MSAGGLEVATTFLRAMPADSGMGFVIVQHLDPTRESLLVELLARVTAMPVVQVADGMRVEPNRVHVIMPAKTLLIKGGVLQLIEPEEPRGQRHPIDRFFSALAEDQKEKAVAIILSGAGSNGTAGLQDIKQAGGLCIAQDPQTARFDSMPRHAIASEVVDYVLAPEKMPDALLRYVGHSYVRDPRPEQIADAANVGINDVLDLLYANGGHDFRQYKRNTLSRRIRRRMGLAQTERLDHYIARLQEDPAEVTALVRDLMINVTAFFRDIEAWDALDKNVITPLVEKAVNGDAIRVWVPACSTGEEAYTIAMLLAERAAAANKQLAVKIFATDAAEHHLGTARRATFPGSMVESLSTERLERFFDKGGDDNYRVKPEIRETVLFAPQNLLRDPPYSRMDLVSCRNLLIYLEPEAQDRVMSLAHFALRENGFLFLGAAETLGRRDDLFVVVSNRWRIYRRAGAARFGALDFASWPKRATMSAEPVAKLSEIAVRTLAERFAPASVMIDRNYRVLHFHGLTDDYLAQPGGAPTLDLLTLAREGLRLTVRGAVQKALADDAVVTLRSGATRDAVSVTASPVTGTEAGERLVLVSFSRPARSAAPTLASATVAADEAQAHDYEEQLRSARDEMRVTVEQFETANEELTAANEEIISVNEELGASNEELEATKEELQALNEELSTVNAQLDRKVLELEAAGDDLRNLLGGNDVATIFLDTKMRIRWFSPATQALFDLIDGDAGRPLANFAQKFADAGLVEKAMAAVETLTASETNIVASNGRDYLLRVLPYRNGANRVDGAVASFLDITDLKATQAATAHASDYAEAVIETVRDPLVVLSADLNVRSANAAFYRLFQTTPPETVGRLVYEFIEGRGRVGGLRVLLEEMLPERGQIDDFEVEVPLPDLGARVLQLNARRIAGHAGATELILLAMEDITERRGASRHQDLMVGELSHRVKNMLAVVQSIASQTRRGSTSLDAFSVAFGGRLEALAGANDAVFEAGWKGVAMAGIVARALKPFGAPAQIVIGDGPVVVLNPKAGVALAMILHELATNAVKYGGFSSPDGQVAVDWRIDSDGAEGRVVIDWTESGGPPVAAPARLGQGARFIERSIAHELGGRADVSYAPEGLTVALSFPARSAMMPQDAA